MSKSEARCGRHFNVRVSITPLAQLNRSGFESHIAAGTVTGTGRELHAVFAAAIDSDAAVRIWMTDEADAVVFDARLD